MRQLSQQRRKRQAHNALTDLPAQEMCSNCHPRVFGLMKIGLHKGLDCNVCHGTMHDDFARSNNKACVKCHGETRLAAAHAAASMG